MYGAWMRWLIHIASACLIFSVMVVPIGKTTNRPVPRHHSSSFFSVNSITKRHQVVVRITERVE